MKLNTYIEREGMTLAAAAFELGITRQALNLWIDGKRIPRPANMETINKWSKGEVTAADFYGDA
jgi:DNA-binding transcriptional regulator YdaS (Cro superfamily)